VPLLETYDQRQPFIALGREDPFPYQVIEQYSYG